MTGTGDRHQMESVIGFAGIRTFKRYEQTVPGHQVQIDVKFLFLRDKANRRIRRYQYTADLPAFFGPVLELV